MVESGQSPSPQDHTKATKAPRLKKADGYLDFSRPAAELARLARGTWPWPGGRAVYTPQRGKTRPVTLARAVAEEAVDGPPVSPGTLDADGMVACGEDRLRILEIQPAGKRLMRWRDFVNGYRAAQGDRFISPSDAS
jgi:methionyl-tRNA formyltransferase